MFEMISVVFKSLAAKPSTRNYPYVVRPTFEGARGHIENNIDDCIFCGMCARKCPTDALEVVRADAQWTIDPFKCIACGVCVEACPKDSLSMSTAYTLPAKLKYTRTLEGTAPTRKAKPKAKPQVEAEEPAQAETPTRSEAPILDHAAS